VVAAEDFGEVVPGTGDGLGAVSWICGWVREKVRERGDGGEVLENQRKIGLAGNIVEILRRMVERCMALEEIGERRAEGNIHRTSP
jgi:hypothetical protein